MSEFFPETHPATKRATKLVSRSASGAKSAGGDAGAASVSAGVGSASGAEGIAVPTTDPFRAITSLADKLWRGPRALRLMVGLYALQSTCEVLFLCSFSVAFSQGALP